MPAGAAAAVAASAAAAPAAAASSSSGATSTSVEEVLRAAMVQQPPTTAGAAEYMSSKLFRLSKADLKVLQNPANRQLLCEVISHIMVTEGVLPADAAQQIQTVSGLMDAAQYSCCTASRARTQHADDTAAMVEVLLTTRLQKSTALFNYAFSFGVSPDSIVLVLAFVVGLVSQAVDPKPEDVGLTSRFYFGATTPSTFLFGEQLDEFTHCLFCIVRMLLLAKHGTGDLLT